LTLFVNAVGRAGKQVTLAVEFGGEVDARVLANLGVKGLRPAPECHVDVGLSLEAHCPEQGKPEGKPRLELKVERDVSVPVFVSLQARRLQRGQYQLVHVVERSGDKLLGGVSFLVVNTRGHQQQSTNSTEEQQS